MDPCGGLRQDIHGIIHGDDAHHPLLSIQHRQGQQVIFRQEPGGLFPVCERTHRYHIRDHQVRHSGILRGCQQVLGRHHAQQLPVLQHIAGIDRLLVDSGAADGIQRLPDRIARPEGDKLRRHDAAGTVRRIAQQGIYRHTALRAGGAEDAGHQVSGKLLQKIRRVVQMQGVKNLLQLPVRERAGQGGLSGTGEIGEHICRQVLGQRAEHRRLPGTVLHGVQEGGDVHGAAALPKGAERLAVPALQKLKDLILVEHGHSRYLAFVCIVWVADWRFPWSAPPFCIKLYARSRVRNIGCVRFCASFPAAPKGRGNGEFEFLAVLFRSKKIPAGNPAGRAAHNGRLRPSFSFTGRSNCVKRRLVVDAAC